MEDLHPATESYIEKTSDDERKQKGQYFTPKSVCDEILMKLPQDVREIENRDILDPSSGTGEFLRSAKTIFKNPNLYGWEIDEELVGISKKVIPEAKIENTNTIEKDTSRKFDIIIGNPPYYETNLEESTREEYDEIIYGRTNIYSIFIYKGLKLLKKDGYLAFVVPPSMNNGAYFKKLRDYIINNASIEYLSVKENSEIFEGASQPIMYLILKKGGKSDDYVFSKNDLTIFSEKSDYLEKKFENKKSLSELGYIVRTGRLTWNEHKEKLKEDKNEETVPIIWSKNIKKNCLKVGKNVHKKPQYIENFDSSEGPAIVVNRVVGQPGKGEIRADFIEEGRKFVAENHVNVIEKDRNPKIKFKRILRNLNSKENVELIQTITGNSQISKTELQELFPISEN